MNKPAPIAQSCSFTTDVVQDGCETDGRPVSRDEVMKIAKGASISAHAPKSRKPFLGRSLRVFACDVPETDFGNILDEFSVAPVQTIQRKEGPKC